MILWLKALHIIFMVTWFAGLFYLQRLFVYHAMCEDSISDARFKIMERKLYLGIITPCAVVKIEFDAWPFWLMAKDCLVNATLRHLQMVLIGALIAYLINMLLFCQLFS